MSGKVRASQRDRYREGAPLPKLTANGSRPSMKACDLLHQCQSDACALVRTGPSAFDAVKPLEDLRQIMLVDAGPGIPHQKLDMVSGSPQDNADLSFERKLQGVRKQVQNDLFPHLPLYSDRLPHR